MNRAWLALSLLAIAARPGVQEPRLYNQGVTAYHSNDFAEASQAFEQALPSPDRRLQEQALYNLGNALYRLGEAQPQQAQQIWQRAIKNYESALALDSKDEDAKFNREFVKKKLEELQKQQQQNQQDKKQDQKKDDQQQQQKQDQQQQPKPNDKQDQQQKSQDQQKQDKKDQQQQGQDQKDRQQKPEQQPQLQQGSPDTLEKQQAKALLDNLREEERNWNFFPEAQMKDLQTKGPPAKDW